MLLLMTDYEMYLPRFLTFELFMCFKQAIICSPGYYVLKKQEKQEKQKMLIKYIINIENFWFIVLWYPGELTLLLPIKEISLEQILTSKKALTNILFYGPFCRYEKNIGGRNYMIYEWSTSPKEKLKELSGQNVKNLSRFLIHHQN